MSARDEERDELFNLWLEHGTCFESDSSEGKKFVEAILAAGYQRPRTITTTDEVDELPAVSIVRTCFGDGVNIYRPEGVTGDHHHVVVYGPATVLYEPEVAA